MTKDPGGKGANIAMAACRARDALLHDKNNSASQARLERIAVFLNGAVGADEPGTRLLEHLNRGGVDTSRVQTIIGEATATGIVLLETTSDDSRSLAYHGAMSTWRMPDPSKVNCLTSGSLPDLVVANLTAPQAEVAKIFAAAAKEGVPTVFNPSPIQDFNWELFSNVTHLILNQSEAAVLHNSDLALSRDHADWAEAATFFLELGVSNVVLTLAAEGAYYATSSGGSGHVEAMQDVQCIDATGAGVTPLWAHTPLNA